ncbi:short integuments 2 [Cucumis melo var. makuwa]|uniref:Short integuments 2 n=1 Tax=Cucumis melo var. makuwa TaxID=1194695 RepID=A0A5D3CKY0_CUCMM|nr:short integuments 2 [Cucumis melo var. makuwa]
MNVHCDLVTEVQCALYTTLSEFDGNVEDENGLESLIEVQFEALQKAMKVSHMAAEARLRVSKKLLTLFRAVNIGGKLLALCNRELEICSTAPRARVY